MNSIGQSIFELESGNGNVDRQMDTQMELHQFKSNLAMMMIYLAMMMIYLCQV